MKPKPTNSSHPKIFQSPAAAAAAASVTAAYALTKPGKLDFAETEDSNNKVDLSVEINAIREAKKVIESSLVDVRAETSALKAKLEETNTTYADLSKVCSYAFPKKNACSYDRLLAQVAANGNFSHRFIYCRNSIRFKVNW